MRTQSPSPLQMLPRRRALPLLLLTVALGCGEGVTDVSSKLTRRRLTGEELAAVQLLQCPQQSSEFDALGVVSVWGGTIEGEYAHLLIPESAVDETTGITVEAPASPYLEFEFRAGGLEHYTFDRPITIQIDYSRCAAGVVGSHAALRVVYIDAETKQPLEDMGGVVDSVAHTITFRTGHFSSYAVAD